MSFVDVGRMACRLVLGVLLLPAVVAAQPAPTEQPAQRAQPAQPAQPRQPEQPEQPAQSAAGDDDADLADIKDALGSDAKAREAAGTVRRSTPARTLASRLNPDISFIGDVAFAVFSGHGDHDHGAVEDGADDHAEHGGHTPTETGFHLQQLEMSLKSVVDPYFRLDGYVVFSEHGVEIEELFATTTSLPHNLQARMGQMLTRIGRTNATHPHTWEFVDQPMVIDRYFGAEGNRGVGVELSYLTPLPWFVEVVGMVNNASGEGVRSFGGEQEIEVESPLHFQTSLMVKQFFDLSDNLSLLWGLSATTGPNASDHDARTNIVGTDVYLKYRPITRASYTIVSLQGEWYFRERDIVGDKLRDHGGYAQVFHRFARRWGWAGRYEFGRQAKNTDGLAQGDELDPEWTKHRHRTAAALTFWPTEFSRIRLQASADFKRWEHDPTYAGFLTFQFIIGKHGAHTF